jgi:hypothetical protein
LDSSGSGYETVVSSCEQVNEISGSIKCREFLDQRSEYYLLMKDFTQTRTHAHTHSCVRNQKISESEIVLAMIASLHATLPHSIFFQCVNWIISAVL